jgi:5'-3' exonuclease
LKRSLEPVYPLLSAEERRRNVRGDDRLYIRENHRGYGLLTSVFTPDFDKDTEIQLDGQLFEGMRGRVLYSYDSIEPDG